MEKIIDGKKCIKLESADLRDGGMCDTALSYYESYGYEIYKPVDKENSICVYEPDDKDYRFAMEFLSIPGVDSAFCKWNELAKKG